MNRNIFRIILPLCCALILAATSSLSATEPLKRIGSYSLPTGLTINGVEFGGISGLDYNPETGNFIAISDDRSQRAPARFYDLGIAITASGIESIDVRAVHYLKNKDSKTFPPKGIDPESIRYSTDYRGIFWASESDSRGNPGIYKADLDGILTGTFSLPSCYLPGKEKKYGVYNNAAFEGLTLSTDGSKLIAITENGLRQDGGRATLTSGSPSRIIMFNLATEESIAEYIYPVDPVPTPAATPAGWQDNGASAILAIGATEYLVLERSYAKGVGDNIRIYRVSLQGADNIRGVENIAGRADLHTASKKLLAEITDGSYGIKTVDNLEALCFGPLLDGKQTIILASDNNFSRDQETQFHVFTVPGSKR